MTISASRLWIVSLLILLTWIRFQSVEGELDPAEAHGLRLLSDGFTYPQLIGWDGENGPDPCRDQWQGITCDPDGTTVMRIELPDLALQGYIDSSQNLQIFQHLRVLDLSNNELQGMIPYRFPDSLVLLNFQGNDLEGNIPWSMGNLVLLTELKLGHNNLNGTIPDNFKAMTSLITLDLSDNVFTGALPATMGMLPSLGFLFLQDNNIDSGLQVLKELNLRTLDVSKNSFHEPGIPEWVRRIPTFQYSKEEFIPLPPSPSPSPAPATAPESAAAPDFDLGPSPHIAPSAGAPLEFGFEDNSGDGDGDGEGDEDEKRNSVSWSPQRIAGLTAALLLTALAFALIFLYFSWKSVHGNDDDSPTGKQGVTYIPHRRSGGHVQNRDMKHWSQSPHRSNGYYEA